MKIQKFIITFLLFVIVSIFASEDAEVGPDGEVTTPGNSNDAAAAASCDCTGEVTSAVGIVIQEKDGLANELNSVKGQLEASNNQLETTKSEMNVLVEQLEAATSEVKSLSHEVETLKGKITSSDIELSSMKSELDAATKQLTASQAEVEEMKKKLIDDIEAVQKSSKESVITMGKKLKQTEDELKATKSKKAMLENARIRINVGLIKKDIMETFGF